MDIFHSKPHLRDQVGHPKEDFKPSSSTPSFSLASQVVLPIQTVDVFNLVLDKCPNRFRREFIQLDLVGAALIPPVALNLSGIQTTIYNY